MPSHPHPPTLGTQPDIADAAAVAHPADAPCPGPEAPAEGLLSTDCEPLSLSGVLDMMHDAGTGDRVSVGNLLDTVGTRSAGPLLLVPSLIIVTPVSGIPGAPTVAAAIITLVAVQMMLGSTRIWMPQFIRRRTITRSRLQGAVRWLRPFAARVDRVIWPRLTVLTRRPFNFVLVAACMAMALAMPPLEVVPMSSSTLAGAISLLALALTAHDGLLALIALALAIGGVALGLNVLL